jgi:hypothetical protein
MRTSTHRIRRQLGGIVIALAFTALVAPAAYAGHTDSKFIPGWTDNPSRLGVEANEEFIAGFTDVPSRLGVHGNDGVLMDVGAAQGIAAAGMRGEAQARAYAEPVQDSPARPPVISADGFDWRDAAIGASVAILAMLLAAATVLAARKRVRLEASA